jgi:hypothetical protein
MASVPKYLVRIIVLHRFLRDALRSKTDIALFYE